MLSALLLLPVAKALAQSTAQVFRCAEQLLSASVQGPLPKHLPLKGGLIGNRTAVAEQEAGNRRAKQSILTRETRFQQPALHRKTLLGYVVCALAVLLLGIIGLAYRILRANRRLAAHQLEALERKRQHATATAMLHGQDAERSRLARDLHDSLGGMLSTVKHYLGAMHRNLQLPEDREVLFLKSLRHLDGCIEELRRVAHDMMPVALQRFGLVPALQNICDSLNNGQPPHVRFQSYGLESRLPEHAEIVVYRLVQELVNNAVTHASAQQIIVQLTHYDGHLQLVVEDNGCGFRPATTQAGMGLRNIQARADYLHGSIDWCSVSGQGTTATIDFPFPNA